MTTLVHQKIKILTLTHPLGFVVFSMDFESVQDHRDLQKKYQLPVQDMEFRPAHHKLHYNKLSI